MQTVLITLTMVDFLGQTSSLIFQFVVYVTHLETIFNCLKISLLLKLIENNNKIFLRKERFTL